MKESTSTADRYSKRGQTNEENIVQYLSTKTSIFSNECMVSGFVRLSQKTEAVVPICKPDLAAITQGRPLVVPVQKVEKRERLGTLGTARK